jgi:mono/diheme cytochrome c family protein
LIQGSDLFSEKVLLEKGGIVKKALKWIGIILGSLVGLIILVAVGLSIAGGMRLNKTHDIQAEAIPIPTDAAALARGEHLVEVALCKECHGQDLSGDVVFDDPAVGTVYATNITGLGATHSDADLVRAIRHGVDKDGRQLVIMPADIFINFSAEDLGAVIAYLKTVPAVDNAVPEPKLSFMGRILLAAGMFTDVFPAEYIDHNQPFPTMPEIGANVEYGAYLAPLCTTCHGADLAGAVVDPDDPESLFAPNLTPGGELGDWSEADFIQTIRTGVSPHGHELDPAFMPWEAFAKFHDDELKALWLYLQSLPPERTQE